MNTRRADPVLVPLVAALAAAATFSVLPAEAASRAIQVTRDPTHTPLTTYSEQMARVGPPGEFQLTEMDQVGGRGTGTIALIVETSLYPSISTAFQTLVNDLQVAGYTVHSAQSSGGTPNDLKNYLRNISGLVGAVLIGDLAIPWFEIDYEFDGADADTLDDEYTNFPCDLFYMDLDGTWQDLLVTSPFIPGVYDSHTAGSGDTAPDIWVSRLTTSTLTLGGSTEAGLINNYLGKNHRFRQGDLHPTQRMLLYVDDDWVDTAQYCDSSADLAYADRMLIQDKATTCRNDYRDLRLTQGHELMHVMLHSTPTQHFFKVNDQWEMDGGNYAAVTSADVRARDPVSIFYNLYTCSAARYVETDHIGGWYVFSPTTGLAALGTTKVGGMWDYATFYGALGAARSFGGAFQDWLAAQAPYDQDDVRWYYGMTLLGDGALGLRPSVVAADPARFDLSVPQNVRVRFQFDRAVIPTGYSVRAFGSCSGKYWHNSQYDAGTRTLTVWGGADLMDGEVATAIVTPDIVSSDWIPAFPDVRTFTAAIGNPTPGVFVAGTTVTAPDVMFVLAGDWNRDGWPDLAAACSSPNDRLYVAMNNGAGQFLAPVIYATGPDPRYIASGDLDSDGDLDLAVSNTGSLGHNNGVGIYFNQGNGSFSAPTYYYAGYYPSMVICTDFDGDGDLDLAMSTSPNFTQHYLSLLKNNGMGIFQQSQQYWVTTNCTINAQIAADIDSDGDMDLVGVRSGTDPGQPGDSLVYFRNNSYGLFTRSCPLALPDGPWGTAGNDFDGDGDVDFAVGSVWTTTMKILRNGGDGTIVSTQDLDQGGYSAHAVACGDWDGDGDIDLAHGRSQTATSVRVWKNNGSGSFAMPADYAVWNAYGMTTGDFDRDRDLDLAVSAGAVYRFDNYAADAIPPARVHDLAGTAEPRAVGSLRWTAPGDDGDFGRGSLYDLRYSATPVGADSAAWWSAARQATGEPLPSPAGVPDSCEIAGLSADSTYYLMIRTRDDASNWSGYSNVCRMLPASGGVDDPAALASGFRLEAVAPNPARAATMIRFHLGTPIVGDRVRLTLFDVQGREVRRLVDRKSCPAGRYAVLWDLRNNVGLPVPSGQYFCRLDAGSVRRTQRLLCLR